MRGLQKDRMNTLQREKVVLRRSKIPASKKEGIADREAIAVLCATGLMVRPRDRLGFSISSSL